MKERKYRYSVLSECLFDELKSQMTQTECMRMHEILKEAANILKFNSYAERLLFEAAFIKGFLASDRNLEKL